MNALNLLLAAIIGYIPYQSHYHVAFDIPGLNLINLMFLAALALILLRKYRAATPAPLKWHFVLFFAALALAAFIGYVHDGSRLPADMAVLKNNIFYMLFYFLFYHAVRDIKDIRFMLGAILFVTFLVSLQAMRQALDYGIGSFSDTHRVAGPFAKDYRGANLAAAYFVVFVPLFFALALYRKSPMALRLVALAGGILGIFAAFFTYSRQAYLILAALLLLQAFRRNLLLGVVLGIAVLNYQAWVPAGVVERLEMTEQAVDESGETALDKSTESRFELWGGAAQMIAEQPWGIGLNRFQYQVGQYVPAYYRFDVHNGYLLIATEAGLQGVLVFIALLTGLLLLARRLARLGQTEEARVLGGAFQLSVMAAMLANLFGSRFFNGEVMGNFWILAGLVARYYTLELERLAQDASAAAPGGEAKPR